MLHVSLLGEQAIADATTGHVRTRSARAVALVAFLVVHAGKPQTRQHIAGLFWPDSTDAQALTNLRRELHHLRQVLADEASLVVTSTDLCWRDTETCIVDVRTFLIERAAALEAASRDDSAGVLVHANAAIARYRGDLLPGSYDDWLLDARAEFERQCVELCDLSSRTRARTGDLSGAVDAGRRRIQLRPLEEIGYRTLMQLQADLGDRAGAVSTYHHCASVLERELGLDPDPATRRQLDRVLAPEQPLPTPPAVDRATGRSGVAAAALVGRMKEFDALRKVWHDAVAGHPSLVLVRGDAGVGKTRLVVEVADLARAQGAVVATSQCFGTSGRLALSPVADWLRNPAVQTATASLEPVWRIEVDRLVPSVSEPGEPGDGSRAMVDAWQRHRFFEGMARALVCGGRPMLLVLDNLQWCDQETLAFLTFCLGLTVDTPIMVAATLRTETVDEAPGLTDWITRMRATGLLTEVSLGPLDVPDTAQLATAISGRPLAHDDAVLLQAVTGGFPLYVVEAARTRVDLGRALQPVGDLTVVLRNRVEQVSPVVREVAGLAAAVGKNFTLDLLTEASDLDTDTVVQAVDELWRRRIVGEQPEGYDFSHDLLREAAYAQVNPAKRWLLHRRIAQALELLHSNDIDAVSAELAVQYSRGGRADRAVAYYRRAADIAAGRFAHDEAIRLFRTALSIVLRWPANTDRDRQELEILEAMAAPLNARHGYSSPQLKDTLERSIVIADSLGRKDSVLVALIGLWTSQYVRGDLDGGEHTVARALNLVETVSEQSGPSHFAYGGWAVSVGQPAEALRHFEIAARQSSGVPSLSVGTRSDVHARAWAAHAHWLVGRDDDALSSCRDAIELARSIGHPYSLAVALGYGCLTHQMRQDLAELTDTVAELRELCERYSFAYYREWVLVLDGWCRRDESGIGLVRQGISNLKSAGSLARMPYWLSLFADLFTQSNDHVSAAATLDAAIVGAQSRHELWWLPEVMRMRAAYDAPDAAVSRLRAAGQMAHDHGSVALLARCERDLVERGVRPATVDGSTLR